jgi:hypothetical protein
MSSTPVSIRCPECGRRGFLGKRWVRASRFPKYASVICERFKELEQKLAENPTDESLQKYVDTFRQKYVRGNYYRGNERREFVDWKAVFRVLSDRYYYNYIGHYDPTKYQKQMIDYKNGKRKSRPNGRKWCRLRHRPPGII